MLAQLARVTVGLFALAGLLVVSPAPAAADPADPGPDGGRAAATPATASGPLGAAQEDDPDGGHGPIGSLDPVGERENVRWPTAILMTGAVFALALAWAVGPQVVRWFRDGQQIEGAAPGGRGD